MSDKERLVQFELLGQEHAFYTAAPEEEIESILSLVRSLVEIDTPKSSGTLPVSKVAILACLNIASRYVKLEQEFEEYREDSGSRIVRLNEEIKAKLYGE
ncbi:MAG: cell division protein ZapA [Deltaproteobacteria bacterium]|nr:cell division protein ZapA [Deltaproteobacteria bacterium]MBW2659363.1 cell division protein ZapA [Deltaproteobacteria bacterium]